MAEEKNNNFALIALVAIVAVVGLVVLMKGAGTSAQPIVLEKQAFARGSGTVGGHAALNEPVNSESIGEGSQVFPMDGSVTGTSCQYSENTKTVVVCGKLLCSCGVDFVQSGSSFKCNSDSFTCYASGSVVDTGNNVN